MSEHKKPPRLQVSAADILPFMQEQNRQPFMEVMALCLAARPTPKRLAEFAADYPDRWANMCAIFAKLSGFSEKTEVKATFVHAIADLSDAELRGYLSQLSGAPEQALPQLVERMASGRPPLLLGHEEPVPKAAASPAPRKKLKLIRLKKRKH